MERVIEGMTFHYELAGQGPVLLLLHGWGGESRSFAPVAAHLEKDFTVYNLDLPGFGSSGPPPVPWGTAEYTAFLAAFLEAEGLCKPIIIAHSFGGRLALRLGAMGLAGKMVLTGCAGLKPKRGFDYYRKIYTYKAAKQILRLPVFDGKREKILGKWRQKRGSADYQAAEGVMRQSFVSVVNEDLRPLLPAIKSSTLLFWGEEDTATPLWQGEIMAQEIPDAGLVKVPGAGHFAYLERLPYFLRVVDAFLEPERRN